MSEEDRVDMLLELFDWPTNDKEWRFHALVLLRKARGEEFPTWDDYACSGT